MQRSQGIGVVKLCGVLQVHIISHALFVYHTRPSALLSRFKHRAVKLFSLCQTTPFPAADKSNYLSLSGEIFPHIPFTTHYLDRPLEMNSQYDELVRQPYEPKWYITRSSRKKVVLVPVDEFPAFMTIRMRRGWSENGTNMRQIGKRVPHVLGCVDVLIDGNFSTTTPDISNQIIDSGSATDTAEIPWQDRITSCSTTSARNSKHWEPRYYITRKKDDNVENDEKVVVIPVDELPANISIRGKTTRPMTEMRAGMEEVEWDVNDDHGYVDIMFRGCESNAFKTDPELRLKLREAHSKDPGAALRVFDMSTLIPASMTSADVEPLTYPRPPRVLPHCPPSDHPTVRHFRSKKPYEERYEKEVDSEDEIASVDHDSGDNDEDVDIDRTRRRKQATLTYQF